jgi:tRNA-specific 2-thiouridylase
VADFLQIELAVVDLAVPFQTAVLDYFCASYAQGRTPNPCVICNPLIKFGKLLDYGRSKGIELLATGHYVRLERGADGLVHLLRGLDPKKDQSYFLCRLRQEQLQRLRFPLGATAKEKVYELAAQLGLQTLHGPESQDVCFLQERSVDEFLAERFAESLSEGLIVTRGGRELGRHKGIFRYTVGQRRGLGIPDATPYYVLALDSRRNLVVVGKEEDLWQDSLAVREVNWLSGKLPELPGRFLVKIRYRHEAAPAMLAAADAGIRITFERPQRAVTPGQFAGFYQEDELMGGGEII